MNATALLLTRDNKVQSIVPGLLSGMRIETELVTDVVSAARLLSERKFEAIIVDCELSGAEMVLKDIDSYPSNRTAVLFAVVPQMDVRDGLPGELIRECRRYFRCSLEVPIFLAGGGRELRAKTTTVAIRTLEEIRLAERFDLKFT